MTDKKIIVITGAGSGFGKLAAIELARAGHKVYASMRDLAGHSKDKLEDIRSIASSEGIDLHPLQLDVREEPSCRSAADFVLSVDGRIDVVINNAAMMMAGLTESFRPEQLAQILDLNAISWLRVNRAFLPAMRRQNKGLLLTSAAVSLRSRIPLPALMQPARRPATFSPRSWALRIAATTSRL